MKKGELVPISWKYHRKGFTGDRTEKCTGRIILEVGQKLFHYSDNKILGFEDIETCWYTSKINIEGYEYCLVVEKDISVKHYGDREVRIDFDDEDIRNSIKIYYTGTIKKNLIKGKMEQDSRGRWNTVYEVIDKTVGVWSND